MKNTLPRSEAQIAATKLLAAGPRYARRAMASPTRRAIYESLAQVKDIPPFRLAVMDYFSVPSFEPLDLTEYKGQPGDPIYIQAVDDVGLASVKVELVGIDSVLEQGDAVETSLCSGDWIYTTSSFVPAGATVTIRVTGTDYTGKVVQLVESPVVGG
jgi:hypothetical protein